MALPTTRGSISSPLVYFWRTSSIASLFDICAPFTTFNFVKRNHYNIITYHTVLIHTKRPDLNSTRQHSYRERRWSLHYVEFTVSVVNGKQSSLSSLQPWFCLPDRGGYMFLQEEWCSCIEYIMALWMIWKHFSMNWLLQKVETSHMQRYLSFVNNQMGRVLIIKEMYTTRCIL